MKQLEKELRGDREVVMEAVRRDGLALQHASEELRGDREVVHTSMRNLPGWLRLGWLKIA